MPIGINGSGTITGISAGGLPDGSIVQADLAAGIAGNGPAFNAYANSAQSLTANVATKLQINTEAFDTANCFDSTTNYRFTPTVAGYYQINVNATYSASWSGTNSYTNTYIYKNGSVLCASGTQPSNNNYSLTQVSTIVYLNGSTDYIEFYGVTQINSSLITGLQWTQASAALVRAA